MNERKNFILLLLIYMAGLVLALLVDIAIYYVAIPDYGVLISWVIPAFFYGRVMRVASWQARLTLAGTFPLVAFYSYLSMPTPIFPILAGSMISYELYRQLRELRLQIEKGIQ